MPSFDVVSEANMVEVHNAVDQANKEIGTRFDFRGSDARVDQKEHELTVFGDKVKQVVTIKNGIQGDSAKKIVKLVKDSKLKVQASIQGDAVRVAGAKRDDLQSTMAMLRKEVADLPLDFNNFRD